MINKSLDSHFMCLWLPVIMCIVFIPLTTSTKILRVEKFLQCLNKKNLSLTYDDIILSHNRENIIDLSTTIQLKSTIDGPNYSIVAELIKCKSKEDVSTCEYYTKIKLDNLCNQYHIWAEYMKYTDFPNRCPVHSGNYSLNHAIINVSSLQHLPLFESYWKIKTLIIKDETTIISCTICEFSIEEKKIKKKVVSNKM